MSGAGRSVLVVAAHPDDEILGCGGSMAKHAQAGDTVQVMFLTDGVGARGDDRAAEIEARTRAAVSACACIGVAAPTHGAFPDNQLDTVPLLKIAQSVEDVAARLRPDLVYTHHRGDLNVDHRIAHEAVMTCFRPQPGRPRPTILAFETPSSTEWASPNPATLFVPTWYEDIAATLPLKLQALEIYAAEMRDWPHARSIRAIEHLVRWRGATVGVEAAEAFALVRHVNA